MQQGIAHIDRLVEHREALRRTASGATLDIGAPTYTVITTSPRAPQLDYSNAIFAHARSHGININVYYMRARGLFDWYLDGHRLNVVAGIIGDWYAGIPLGALPDWMRYIMPVPWSELSNVGFTASCTADPQRGPAPFAPKP